MKWVVEITGELNSIRVGKYRFEKAGKYTVTDPNVVQILSRFRAGVGAIEEAEDDAPDVKIEYEDPQTANTGPLTKEDLRNPKPELQKCEVCGKSFKNLKSHLNNSKCGKK